MMNQLLLHLLGDYVLQSHWQALRKTESFPVACLHAGLYAAPFLLLGSPLAVAVIFATHALIDHFRLAKYVTYCKNRCFAPPAAYVLDDRTGFPVETPLWLSTWLLIVVDNFLHLTCNAAALHWL